MKTKYLLAFLLILIGFTSCEKDAPEPPSPKRTVLIYIAGDNSLDFYAGYNLEAIIDGAGDGNLNNNNLLVYIDIKNALPSLYLIKEGADGKASKHEVHTYGQHNSASTATMKEVIDKTMADYPAEEYGLVLWSHGTAWLPSDLNNYLRSFGQDRYGHIEINDLANVLDNYHFNFILFDACYMASIEVAYALRNSADYIISSPYEIMAEGFPYKKAIKRMFMPTTDLKGLCDDFYTYYSKEKPYIPYAAISLVETAGLEELAAACRAIFSDKTKEDLFAVSLNNLQMVDYLTHTYHALYDTDDYVRQLATDPQYQAFQQAMERTVIHKKTTPKVFVALRQIELSVERFSGLSIYVHQKELTKLNEWYKRLDWYKAVYQ